MRLPEHVLPGLPGLFQFLRTQRGPSHGRVDEQSSQRRIARHLIHLLDVAIRVAQVGQVVQHLQLAFDRLDVVAQLLRLGVDGLPDIMLTRLRDRGDIRNRQPGIAQ